MSDEPGLGEKAISQIVEMGLSSQIETADEMAVEVKADLLQAVQGQIDSVAIAGKGVVVQNNLRVEELQLQTDRIDLNPLSALLGQLKLNQPIDSTVRLVLTDDSINQALNQDGVIEALQALELTTPNILFKLRSPIEIRFPADGKLTVQGHASLEEAGETHPLDFDVVAYVHLRDRFVVERFDCQPGQGVSLDFAIALMRWIDKFVKQPSVNWQNMVLQISEFSIHTGQLSLQADAKVS